MPSVSERPEAPTAIQTHLAASFVSLELSRSIWLITSLSPGSTQPYQPSPITLSGRPAHRPFRGLLSVHSRCGPHTRAVTDT
jgi:transposase